MRSLSGFWKKLCVVFAVCLFAFQIYTAAFGSLVDFLQRGIHMFFVIPMLFLQLPASKKQKGSTTVPWYDILISVIGMLGCGFVIFFWEELTLNPSRWLGPLGGYLDIFLSVAMVLICLEAARRTVGWIFPIMSIIMFLYAFFGEVMPGMWYHQNFTVVSVLRNLYHTTSGIWGSMLSLSAGMMAMFTIFGEILGKTGGAGTFIKIGQKFAGRSVGGSGKVALLASALFGMISGSVMGNVLATGTFTIPLMKDDGYSDEWAGAISAVGADGGQIMPPIMGSGAFIMAQFLGVSYMVIARSAIIPALLYYLGSFVAIHYVSKKFGVLGKKLDIRFTAAELAIIIAPLAIFIALLIMGYSVVRSALWSTLVSFVVTVFFYFVDSKKEQDPPAKKAGKLAYDVAISSADSIVKICGLLMGAQIVITMINYTGFGLKLSSLIVSIGRGNLLLCLILTMFVCIILGMGMPTTASYVLASAVLVPPLTMLGLAPLAAHMFAFFFACMSGITPPVCSGVFMASSIAKSDWWKTGWLSVLLALPAFIVPFTFAYNDTLLLTGGSYFDLIVGIVSAVIGAYFMGIGVAGYLKSKVNMFLRLVFLAAGACCIIPTLWISVVGVVICVIAWIFAGGLKKTDVAAA